MATEVVKPYIYENRIGEKRIANNGMEMEIIAYHNCQDIDVKFADGAIVEHRAYSSFIKGNVANPNIQAKIAHHHLGEKRMANNGMEMEIIAYRGASDIDIEFADGTTVYNKCYCSFKTGSVKNPNIVLKYTQRIGEKKIANCGLEMEIIAYRSAADIDVKFSTGEIREHVSYDLFKIGAIKPKIQIGTITKATNGMKMKLVKIRNACDVDVMFEDGAINQHKRLIKFCRGNIGHPAFISNNVSHNFHSVQLQKGFATDNGTYFICTFPNGVKDICTPQQVMERVGIKPVF